MRPSCTRTVDGAMPSTVAISVAVGPTPLDSCHSAYERQDLALPWRQGRSNSLELGNEIMLRQIIQNGGFDGACRDPRDGRPGSRRTAW